MQEISDLKVKRQTYVTQGEAFTARLEELKADRKSLRARVIDEHVKLTAVKGKLTRLAQEIAQLGPVNHAALENLEASQAAMQETERQVTDLKEAIANLEETIRKIDAETRELFRDRQSQFRSDVYGTIRRRQCIASPDRGRNPRYRNRCHRAAAG